jgi:hypothetical protein
MGVQAEDLPKGGMTVELLMKVSPTSTIPQVPRVVRMQMLPLVLLTRSTGIHDYMPVKGHSEQSGHAGGRDSTEQDEE